MKNLFIIKITLHTKLYDIENVKEYVSKYQYIYLYNFTNDEYLELIKYFNDIQSKANSKVRKPKINLILKNNNGFFSRKFDIKNL